MYKFCSLFLACILVLGCTIAPTRAEEASTGNIVIMRASGRLNHTITAKSSVYINAKFSLTKGETVTFDCTYTPKSASVDFGVIAPDGLFYSLNTTTGSINKAIGIDIDGEYTLAIRNNAAYDIKVTGTIRY